MPWMTANSHEYNPIRNQRKDILYLERGRRLIDSEKFSQWENDVTVCSKKDLDRDIEFGLMLDALEMLQVGMDPYEVASIFADAVQREVDLSRISPVQGCIARDLVTTYSSLDVNFSTILPEDSYLHLTQHEVDRTKAFTKSMQ